MGTAHIRKGTLMNFILCSFLLILSSMTNGLPSLWKSWEFCSIKLLKPQGPGLYNPGIERMYRKSTQFCPYLPSPAASKRACPTGVMFQFPSTEIAISAYPFFTHNKKRKYWNRVGRQKEECKRAEVLSKTDTDESMGPIVFGPYPYKTLI